MARRSRRGGGGGKGRKGRTRRGLRRVSACNTRPASQRARASVVVAALEAREHLHLLCHDNADLRRRPSLASRRPAQIRPV